MNSISAKMDEFALRRGNAEGKVQVYQDRPLVMLMLEGLIVGAPVVFCDSSGRQVAHICRISHLSLNDDERARLLSALSISMSVWMGLRDGRGVQVLNPAVFICSCGAHEAYEMAEAFMDKAWLDISVLSLYPWQLSRADEGSKLAAGITWDAPSAPKPILPPPKRVSPVLCDSVTVTCPQETAVAHEVEASLQTVASWLRRARKEQNLVLKFLSYWIALDSSFPNGYGGRYKDVHMLFGFFDSVRSKLMSSSESLIASALQPNPNEIKLQLGRMHYLRNRIVHNGQTSISLSAEAASDLDLSCYLLRHEIVIKGTWILRDAAERGIRSLSHVWPEHALHFVLSDKYRELARSFGRSFFQDVPRELLMAGPRLF